MAHTSTPSLPGHALQASPVGSLDGLAVAELGTVLEIETDGHVVRFPANRYPLLWSPEKKTLLVQEGAKRGKKKHSSTTAEPLQRSSDGPTVMRHTSAATPSRLSEVQNGGPSGRFSASTTQATSKAGSASSTHTTQGPAFVYIATVPPRNRRGFGLSEAAA